MRVGSSLSIMYDMLSTSPQHCSSSHSLASSSSGRSHRDSVARNWSALPMERAIDRSNYFLISAQLVVFLWERNFTHALKIFWLRKYDEDENKNG